VASTMTKRGLLTKSYNEAVAASPQLTLRDKLEALSDAATGLVSGGQQLSSASGNGRSMTFATGTGTMQPASVIEAYQELLMLLDQIESDSPTLDTDLKKKNEMLGRLQPARFATNRYTTLRSTTT